MSLVQAKCPNCNAQINVDNTKEAAVCEFCGTPYVVEKAIQSVISTSSINNSVINIYNSNNNSRNRKDASTSTLSDKELYDRYINEYKNLKKSIRKDKLRWFLASLIAGTICLIVCLIGYLTKKDIFTIFGGIFGVALIAVAIRNLIVTTPEDVKRIKNLNDAYERAKLNRKFK